MWLLALSLRLVAWGLMLAAWSLRPVRLGAWGSVSIGRGPRFMDLGYEFRVSVSGM